MRRSHQRATHQLGDEQGCRRLLLHQRRALYVRKRTRGWDALASSVVSSSSQHGKATGVPHYFLGRVPCRSVSLVAIVVGAAAYERRIVYTRELYCLPISTTPNPRYTVDDGTGTIECAFRPGEGKPESKTNQDQDVHPSTREPATTNPLPCPLIPVGSVVSVQGKVRAKYNSRDLHGETIGLCSTVTPSERSY